MGKLPNLPSLELRHLHTDLIFCYKISFGPTDLKRDNFFESPPLPSIRDITSNCTRNVALRIVDLVSLVNASLHTHTHNRFTAGLEYVRVHPGQQVPER